MLEKIYNHLIFFIQDGHQPNQFRQPFSMHKNILSNSLFTSVPRFIKEPSWSTMALNASLSNETPGCFFLKSARSLSDNS